MRRDPIEQLATEVLDDFAKQYQHHWLAGMRQKLGLFSEETDDNMLIESLLAWMQKAKADFTNTFADLRRELSADDARRTDEEFLNWLARWLARVSRQSQTPAESDALRRERNPAFIPRNHLVEAALAAAENNDLSMMERLLDVLAKPYNHMREAPEYRLPAPETDHCYQTFCGT